MKPKFFSVYKFDEGSRCTLVDDFRHHSHYSGTTPRSRPAGDLEAGLNGSKAVNPGFGFESEPNPTPPLTDILLIEDEVSLRSALSRALSCSGYSVLTASDGKTGLGLLSRHRFRLLITDIFMPENDGLEVIIKQRATQPDCRILAMSGFCGRVDLPTILKTAQVLGSQRTLMKPFRLNEFLEAVFSLLKDSKR